MRASRHARTTKAVVRWIPVAQVFTACEAVTVTVAAGVALGAELLPNVLAAELVIGLLVVEMVADEDGAAAAGTKSETSLDELDVVDAVSKIVASDVKLLVEAAFAAV
ncbi:hypothetical protein LTR95_002091 [Oleoguttula sp. CCFEE 5521]